MDTEYRHIIFKAICERLDILAERDAALANFKQRIEKADENIARTLSTLKQQLDQESLLSIVHELYWEWEQDIKVGLLADILDVGLNAVCKTVGPKEIIAQCRDCGKNVRYKIKSRSSSDPWVICAECKNASNTRIADYKNQHLERLSRLRSMSYQEYLQTPEWQQTRKSALKRSNHRCSVCNANSELHIHHRSYQNLGCETNRDIIVLCGNCHGLFHENSHVHS